MYTPLFSPFPLDLSKIKFGFVYDDSFHNPQDPDIDPSHIHSGYEFYINITGDVCFLVNNKFYPIKRGDVIITKPNDVHICIYNSPCTHEHFCIWLECEENSPLIKFMQNDFASKFCFTEKNKEKLIEILRSLQNSNNDLEKGAQLLNFFAMFNAEKNVKNDEIEMVIPQDMQSVLDYIDANFVEIHSVKEVCDKCFISTATLNRWCKKHINLSPREFLEAKKLALAKKLLSDGIAVNDVCVKAGFSDCSYFISVFKKKFGETPYKYCKKNK